LGFFFVVPGNLTANVDRARSQPRCLVRIEFMRPQRKDSGFLEFQMSELSPGEQKLGVIDCGFREPRIIRTLEYLRS